MKRTLILIALLCFLALAVVVYLNYPRLNIISGYSAKNMDSSVFLAGRDFQFTDTTDNNFAPVNIAEDKIDYKDKTTTASVYGFVARKAMYRDGLGSVLLLEDSDVTAPYLSPARSQINTMLPFPYGDEEQKDTVFTAIDYQALKKAVENAFDEVKKTRAVVVVYKDHIVAEKYAEGFDKNSKILGWSMTKSLTATVYGILQSHGKLSIHDRAPVASWKDDERASITLNDLLHMNSGLEWNEDYTSISDVTKMLFLARDMSKIQEEKPSVFPPDTHWNYSSGTSNLLSGILHNYFDSQQQYLDFWYSAFIDKIGMYSMTVEADLSGNYVGSSYSWATPRDWAKFGLLYLHGGNWNGDQVFNESWVSYVTTPTNTSNGRYGGHFWLNSGGFHPDVPKDIFSANGYQGQRVFIIPSKDLVIVRMGLTEEPNFDFNEFLKGVLSSVK